MELKLKDIYGNIMNLGFSGSGYYRIDFEGENFPKWKHKPTGDMQTPCVSMTTEQATILYHSLGEMLKEEEDQ